MIRFFNTLSKKEEVFTPIKSGKVKMYNCGPTVYDDVHIGNLRAFVFVDVLRRTLEFNGFKVKQILNITDIGHLSSDGDFGEDKMTKGLRREEKPITMSAMKELSNFYTERFKKDLQKLNIKMPTKMPMASSYIKSDIKLIKKLEKKGFAYKTSDGIYFDTSKDKNYGKLGGLSENKEARIEKNSEKKNERDFALWKFSNQKKLGFKSPWGFGFPGWHIECSAMSQKFLGETFDIHTGGMELIPTHHNNEIAQSENLTNKPLANFWLHNEFMNFEGGKMAKSDGNFLKLKDLEEKGMDPISFRYWLLNANYRSPINFSWDALRAAQTAFRKLEIFILSTKKSGKINSKYLDEFKNAINDDLNTSKGLAILWEIFKDNNLKDGDKKKTILEMDKVLGLGLSNLKKQELEIPEEVQYLLNQREKARQEKSWNEADKLRFEIERRGFEIKDTEEGVQLTRV